MASFEQMKSPQEADDDQKKKKHVASDTKVTNRARFYFKSSRTDYDDEIATKTLPVNKEHTLKVYIKYHGRSAHVSNLGSRSASHSDGLYRSLDMEGSTKSTLKYASEHL
jgi:hypothetical protein